MASGSWLRSQPRLARFVVQLFGLFWLSAGVAAQSSSEPGATLTVQEMQVPHKAWLELDQSIEAGSRGDLVQQRSHVERALELHPSFANALVWRGLNKADAGDKAAALED